MPRVLALLTAALSGLTGCLALTPIQAVRVVELTPAQMQEEDDDYQFDPIDSSVVYVREGLRVRVEHLTDTELETEMPGAENPYTYHGEVDVALGHVPVRFTVFQVTVNNPTFDKVLLPPENAVLVTDRGQVMRPYALSRAEARGAPRNFETYWLSRGVQSGNEQKIYLERMGILRGTVFHEDSFVFKGSSYTGKIVFDPLPPGTRSVTLQLPEMVLEFGLFDVPETTTDLSFDFTVQDQVLEPVDTSPTEAAMR